MEDKKKKKEEKKKRETSQKVPEQKIKVPESAKPSCSQPLSTPGSVSPSPGPVSPTSPSPGPGGVSAQVPPGGGNNAKQRTAVANGQPSSSSSSSSSPSGSQTSQQQQRYMSREVPPRFRCQQDHKVLLKRGQPPLSSMLLGGGVEGAAGGGGGWAPSASPLGADNNNTNASGHADSNMTSSSPLQPKSSSLCVAALSSSTTSTYANSTWGAGPGSQSSSQGCERVIVDGTDLEDWPAITGGAKQSSDGAAGRTQEQDCPSNNNSASWGERSIQQKGGVIGEGGAGNTDNPSPPRSSPLSSSSSLNECAQSSGGAWGSSTSSQVEAGPGSAEFYSSKVSHLLSGSQEGPVSGSNNSGVTGANFNPSVNPSAWPALGQSGTTTSNSDSLPLHSPITSASSFSASTTLITTQTLSSVNQTGLYQQHTDTAVGAKSEEQQQHLQNPGSELGSGGGSREAGPNQEGDNEESSGVTDVEGSDDLSGSLSSSSVASSRRSMPPLSSEPTLCASQADLWGGGGTVTQGQEGTVWGFGSQDDRTGWGRGTTGGDSAAPAVSH